MDRDDISVKTHRLYSDSIVQDVYKIVDPLKINYLKNVLRLKQGSLIRVFDPNMDEFLFVTQEITNKKIILGKKHLIRSGNENSRDKSDKLTAAICLLKNNNMFEVIDVATQIGVDLIQIVVSERSQVYDINYDKIKSWIIESSEQSERLSIPQIATHISLDEFLESYKRSNVIVASEHSNQDIKIATSNNRFNSCLIGPEGGFSKNEITKFDENNITQVSLGNNILRSYVALAKILSIIA